MVFKWLLGIRIPAFYSKKYAMKYYVMTGKSTDFGEHMIFGSVKITQFVEK